MATSGPATAGQPYHFSAQNLRALRASAFHFNSNPLFASLGGFAPWRFKILAVGGVGSGLGGALGESALPGGQMRAIGGQRV